MIAKVKIIMKMFRCLVPVVVLLMIKDASARPGKFKIQEESFFLLFYNKLREL